MMRIGIDARPAVWYRGTGIGNYTHQLVKHLQQLDRTNEYRLLWPDNCPAPELAPGWQATPMSRKRAGERDLINTWLRDEGIDVYHVPQNGLRAPDQLGSTKLVVSIHDLIPYVLPEYVRYSFSHRFLREVPDAASRATRVITVSERSAQDLNLILGVGRAKIRVVYPAPEEVFRPLDASERGPAKAQMASRYGILPPYLLYVGGITPRKNLMDLVYAFSKVCRLLTPQMTLVITGAQGEHAGKITALIDLLGLQTYVRLPGAVPLQDLRVLYSLASFLVYPSLYEGFGLPPLEAMACGTPVVCSDAGSLPEVVGRAGMFFRSGDVTALAEAIHRIAEDSRLRETLIARGERWVTRFSWAHAAAGILSIYREAASQEQPQDG